MDPSDFVQHYGLQLNQLHQQYVAQQHILLNAYQFGGNHTRAPPFHVVSYLSCSQCPHSEQDVPRMVAHVKTMHQHPRPQALPKVASPSAQIVPPLPGGAQLPNLSSTGSRPQAASTSVQTFPLVSALPTSSSTGSRFWPEGYSWGKGMDDPFPSSAKTKTPGSAPPLTAPKWDISSMEKTTEDTMYLPGLGKPINEDWNKSKIERQAIDEGLSPRSKPGEGTGHDILSSAITAAEDLRLTKSDGNEDGNDEGSAEGGKKGKKKKGGQR